MGAGAQKSGGAAALPAPPPPRSLRTRPLGGFETNMTGRNGKRLILTMLIFDLETLPGSIFFAGVLSIYLPKGFRNVNLSI